MDLNRLNLRKLALVTGIEGGIALIYWGIGRGYHGPGAAFVNGYLLDILIPVGCYFLLSPVLRSPFLKGILVFGAATAVELIQFLRISGASSGWLLGRTFDFLDLGMYAAGVLFAGLLDRQVFSKAFAFWSAAIWD